MILRQKTLEKITFYMSDKKVSQRKIAKITGLSQTTVRRILMGKDCKHETLQVIENFVRKKRITSPDRAI